VRAVSNPATFQPCEFSFLGAVAGVFEARGVKCDTVDVGGYSGYAFLTKVTEGWVDPGSPSLHSGNVTGTPSVIQRIWSEMRDGAGTIGPRMESFWDPRQYGFGNEPPRAGERQRAAALFERVKQEVDRDRPAIVWGLAEPEYGIVNGCTEDSYVVSTFRSLIGQPDDPVRHDELKAKGGLEAIFVGETHSGPTETDDRLALGRALTMAQGLPDELVLETPRHPFGATQRYATGPEALDEWASVLKRYDGGRVDGFALNYVAACAEETKRLAAGFLGRLAERYADRPWSEPLERAASAYERTRAELAEVVELFPLGASVTEVARHTGARHIRAAKPHEEAAIAALREANEAWD
jgi:hypothetical protein